MMLLLAWAFAQEPPPPAPTRVFVSEFYAVNPDAAGLASLLSGFLVSEFEEVPELAPIPVWRAPDIQGYSASTYLLSCPQGEFVGCAYVIADSVEAQYAIAGTVETFGEGSRVRIAIIDVADSREALAFELDLGVGDDELFAAGVADVLLAVIEGEQGQIHDIRDGDEPSSALDIEAVDAELQQLAHELGGSGSVKVRQDRDIDRPEYTMDDLGEDMASDATKPWELLGMSPEEYLRFKNSGLTVQSWRSLARGRKGQLLLHVDAGVSRAAWSTQYRGWYTIDPATFAIVEARAWQVRTPATGFGGQLWVGYGLTPMLQADLGVGLVSGRYGMHIQKEQMDQEPLYRDGTEFSASNLVLGGRLLAVPFPTRSVRPRVGVGASFVVGEGTSQNQLPGQGTGLPAFDGGHMVLVNAQGGAEVSLSPVLDLSLELPFSFLVGGPAYREFNSGTPGSVQSFEPAAPVPALGVGLQAGLTVHLGGRAEGGDSPERFDEYED